MLCLRYIVFLTTIEKMFFVNYSREVIVPWYIVYSANSVVFEGVVSFLSTFLSIAAEK